MKQSQWEVIYYEDDTGRCPVLDFLKTRTTREQAKFTAWVQQLTIKGPLLPRPYADLLRDGIHELRIKLSRDQVRSLYFFYHQNQIIMPHASVRRRTALLKTNRQFQKPKYGVLFGYVMSLLEKGETND